MKYNWYAIKIVIICVIVFILQFILPITDNFALISSEFLFKPWTIVTYIFLHGSPSHIFGNMFALALFGSILEKLIGGKKFLIVFFVSGIIAGIGSILFYGASIGASGAIYGIFGTLAILRPRMTVYMGFGAPMPMIAAVFFWALLDFLGFFTALDNVAYAAHLFGLAFGLIYGFYLKKEYGEKRSKRRSKTDISEEEIRKWEDRWLS
ncbi:MAG: rhomboid family intramembrane serine protease [Candidatus Aenigmarchaeota archaeon]|nr:rhomboid family intramembrane serine protease [Candidatus Aenigmarchaeota archaeon]